MTPKQKTGVHFSQRAYECMMAQARAEARTAALEEAASLLGLNADQLLLMAGEMTAQELRTVRAVLRNRAAAIRALIEESP
ncbi:hypothetical protein [Labrys sp. ZIDIC5]|uniref:hypothetical protein n=1 Tax=Labrys sedimenti TaxID=3106036 RepID=UPI002ACAB26F|nr:hypothetical protein [Labrys sp. ZIDIC5]MDZ5448925.1 hypothetical protein [Labrys sp. ZIDIC5]